MAEFDQELDACGLNCPLPILRAKKSVVRYGFGQSAAHHFYGPRFSERFRGFFKANGQRTFGFK